MFLSKLKLVAAIVLTLGIGGGAAGVVGGAALAARLTDDPEASPTPLAQHPPRAPATSVHVENGVVQKVDAVQRTITIVSRPESGPLTRFIGTTGIELAAAEKKVATNARILIDDKEGKLEDLAPETSVKLTLTRSSVVIRVEATGSTMQSCFVKGLDLIKHVLTVSHYGNQYQYKVARDARVVIDGRHGTLTVLKEDMPVVLDFSAVGKRVIGIRATGPTVACVVKEVDSARRTLTVRLTQEHLTVPGIPIANDARIVLNGQDATLGDLKPGMSIVLQMSADPDSSQALGVQTLIQNNQHN